MDRLEVEDEGNVLRAILTRLPELVLLLDLEGVIQYMNRAEPGYKPEDFVGRTAHELSPAETQEVFDRTLEAVMETGEMKEFDAEVALEDGFHAWYRTRMFPFPEPDRVTHVLLVSSNVTELKAMEEEAEKLRGLLPVCSWCDRIRNAEGEWESVEDYLAREANTSVSHGICPECSLRELGEADDVNGSSGPAAANQ